MGKTYADYAIRRPETKHRGEPVPDSSRNKTRGTTPKGLPSRDQGPATSIVRVGVAALLVVIGIAWMAIYINVAQDGGSLTWMGDLGRWNFLIGFGLLFLGLAVSAHPSTPLGRGRGVVAGMLGCFIIGLIWIVVYYVAGADAAIPVIRSLEQYNLVVGIGFMAVGFMFATRWE
jgi:uncharacterized membrane protein YdjX (TVP38/TMEM64 family)